MTFTYIAGDIGGTNARIHLFEVPEKGDEQLLAQKEYSSQNFPDLTNIINLFLKEEAAAFEYPKSACFSVAGPVKDGNVVLTNLGWNLSEKEMQGELGIASIVFLNDFAACGYGIRLLRDDELFELTNNKKPAEGGLKAIIGAGTGLGEAFMIENKGEWIVFPGEGGHTDFAPRNKVEFDLMLFIKNKLNLSRVGVERVVSGPGLEQIYWFFVKNDPKLENPETSAEIRNASRPGRLISKLAVEKEDALCEKALRLFISCYGAEAGNHALNLLPAGGVYVTGGIAPQLRDVIKEEFLKSFYNKGRMREMLSTYPIYIVMNPSIGILGARYIARQKIVDFAPKIRRELSAGDIKDMSSEVGLLSEEPMNYHVDNTKPRKERPQMSDAGSAHAHLATVHKPKKHSSLGTANNLLWMGAGFGISVLLLGAFIFGRRTK